MYRISHTSVKTYGKYGQKFGYAFPKSGTVTKPIFWKIVLYPQSVVENFCTEFDANPFSRLVPDTR